MHKVGVFWIVDDELLAVTFDESVAKELANSSKLYDFRLLWDQVKPEKCNKSCDYYPRGRVCSTPRGIALINLGMSVNRGFIPNIIDKFSITEEYKLNWNDQFISEKERQEKIHKRRKQIKASRRNGLI